jgi:hypothetical protein
MIAKDPRSESAAVSPKDSRPAIKLVARIRAIAPPPYPAAKPIDDKVSAARPWASFGSRLAVKIEAISNDTVATIIEAMIPTCDVAGNRARVMHAAAPAMELITTAR